MAAPIGLGVTGARVPLFSVRKLVMFLALLGVSWAIARLLGEETGTDRSGEAAYGRGHADADPSVAAREPAPSPEPCDAPHPSGEGVLHSTPGPHSRQTPPSRG
ncbi:hypothetical protein ACFOWE_16750 [Planomonospora corallina]|uniref:Uncharacterized protein n=1 Tax=Planomonospora corallina TaxID=1806052 RepID=A0ABV8I7B0_9ACTN